MKNNFSIKNMSENNKPTSKKIVGIDLGTTNSVVAVLEGANPNVIPNAEGGRTTPSVVAYTASGEALVGQLAKRQAVVNPENTFFSVKRFIGSKFDEITSEIDRIPYEVKKDSNGNIKLSAPIVKKEFSPEEISASVLQKLAGDASRFLKETVNQAIVTVPAYFNDSQRLATKDAGIIAGLDVLRILNEPTAAALAYGLNKQKNEAVLIFDLGGGTFDVSILEVGDEVFEVLATSGDTHLGGDDFDQIIVDYIIKDFQKKEGIDLYNEKQALQRIIEAAEKAKIELSSLQSTKISLPFIYVDGIILPIVRTKDPGDFYKVEPDGERWNYTMIGCPSCINQAPLHRYFIGYIASISFYRYSHAMMANLIMKPRKKCE